MNFSNLYCLFDFVHLHISKINELTKIQAQNGQKIRENFGDEILIFFPFLFSSPTMRISHRVLTCFFENCHILFGDSGQFKKYVPPITSSSVNLPETETGIEEEIRKQESLLADLHLQISSGAASKKTEEQIWEQQRIVTQLKRKLRTAIKKGMC